MTPLPRTWTCLHATQRFRADSKGTLADGTGVEADSCHCVPVLQRCAYHMCKWSQTNSLISERCSSCNIPIFDAPPLFDENLFWELALSRLVVAMLGWSLVNFTLRTHLIWVRLALSRPNTPLSCTPHKHPVKPVRGRPRLPHCSDDPLPILRCASRVACCPSTKKRQPLDRASHRTACPVAHLVARPSYPTNQQP